LKITVLQQTEAMMHDCVKF